MSTLRTRNFDSRMSTGGTYYQKDINYWKYSTAKCGPSGSCEDTIGNQSGVNACRIIKWNRFVPKLSGTKLNTNGTLNRQFVDYGIDRQKSPENPETWAGGLPDLQTITLDLLASTNPSTAHVSIPTFIGELKDLPDLVKGWGDGLLKAVAKGNISWRWAIRPMISDIRKMCDFNRAVNKRIDYLRRLQVNRSVRRRKSYGKRNETVAVSSSQTLQSVGAVVTAKMSHFYTESKWATICWRLDPGVVLPTNDTDLWQLAKRLVLGVTKYEALNTMWELTPWSWFVDWFAHVGDWIQAHNNSVPVVPVRGVYCRTSTSYTSYHSYVLPVWNEGLTLSGPHYEQSIVKQRWVLPSLGSILPLPSLPILTAGQWSILGSLAALRGRK